MCLGCGNGRVEMGEECDAGAPNWTDATCKQCVSAAYNYCESDIDCHNGDRCIADRICAPQLTCAVNEDCPPPGNKPTVCVAGICRVLCNGSAECFANQACSNGLCTGLFF